ncbi:tetratricopeptide repeat protein,protein kinase family protein [Rivularia sp. PCC 7116]|uniref:serine/threonine-protein kinase n=1 Tax=Rivularia sp. PCC 7116 TaxID=373994 RepID=UPI00029EDFC4|nr:serine/threonine-protein kinase [Rivularia sp. PCC 7116]AFY57533.1 tetratricopeptide repeat protein,protein kinase family protein [Rivularia sp. PCC 7116]
MIYCINPECKQRENPDNISICQYCGTSLLVNQKYRLIKPLRPLTQQSYADIFEVTDGENSKVIKVLKVNSPQFVKMFEREAFTLQLLNHPGIPKVEPDDYFTFTPNDYSGELHCLVMEKIPGQNLEQWLIENGVISSNKALDWLRQLVEILDVLHTNYFFHRDIKPSNIIIRPDGKLALIDFGTVRDISNTYLVKIGVGGNENLTTTMSGGYTPQEQIDGKAVPQSDFYALGRTFVYLLTGKSPTELPNNPKTGKLIWRDKARNISHPLADFIDEMTARLPADRPQRAFQMLEDLNPEKLFLKRILRFLMSPQLKFISTGFLITLASFFLIQLWTRPLRAAHEEIEGREALQDRKFEDARKHFEEATKLNPNKADYQNSLGLACKLQKDFECALNQYEKSLELGNGDILTKATVYYNIATLFEDIRDFDKAIEYYKKVIAYQSNKDDNVSVVVADARNNYARLLIWQKQNNQKAIEEISKSLKYVEPKNASRTKSKLYKNLGWTYLQLGNLQAAKKYLEKAIELDEYQTAAAHCLQATVLQQIDSKDTLSSWQKCRDYDADGLPEVETWQLDAIRNLNSTKQQK